MKYKLHKTAKGQGAFGLLDDGRTVSFEFDDNNPDYKGYLRWLEEGNQPEPSDPVVEPAPLTPKEKLANAGLTVEELKTILGLT